MAVGFEWLTEFLGIQRSVAQFGAQQVPLQSFDGVAPIECSSFLVPKPDGFESTSLAIVRKNLAVVPVDWLGGGIRTDAKLDTIYSFVETDAEHVHEAPVYVSSTNELVFADTSMRKINTNPPLENVNGATAHSSRVYFTTNGGRAPAIWNCSAPMKPSNPEPETIDCLPVVNNYRLTHFNSPNDLIFTSQGHILFTDPTYGWNQGWPGVGAPELPTATYHFDTRTGALTTLDNDQILQPNGLALSYDEKTLYLADSNSTSDKPIRFWQDSVRNVYAFDFDEENMKLCNRRLVHVVESGWPDGLRLTSMKNSDSKKKSPLSKAEKRDLLLVASMGGVDVVDVSHGHGAGRLLGKFNVGDDIIFNLEPIYKKEEQKNRGGHWQTGLYTNTWLLTGRKGVYKVSLTLKA